MGQCGNPGTTTLKTHDADIAARVVSYKQSLAEKVEKAAAKVEKKG